MVWTLNSDLSINTFSYLSSVDLLNISLVSKNFYKQSASNFCWQPLLSKLWCDKVFIQPRIRQLATEYAKLAYFISIADSKRSFMTQEEVSYFTFSFRFKEAAGTEWTNICPWNNGHEASKVSFNVDGSAIRIPSNRPDSSIHMAIESMYSGFRMNWVLRRRHQRSLRKSTPFQYFYALNQVIETYIIDNNSQTNIHSSEYNKDLNSFAVPISNDSVPHDEQQSVNLSNSKIRKISSQSMSTGSQEERSAKHRSSSTELNWLTIFKNCMNSTFCTPDSYLNSVGENLQLLVSFSILCLFVCSLIEYFDMILLLIYCVL